MQVIFSHLTFKATKIPLKSSVSLSPTTGGHVHSSHSSIKWNQRRNPGLKDV